MRAEVGRAQPRDSNIPLLGNIPYIVLGILLYLKVFSFIKGCWSIWEVPSRFMADAFGVSGFGPLTCRSQACRLQLRRNDVDFEVGNVALVLPDVVLHRGIDAYTGIT